MARISFDEKFKTFRIYFGTSLYALCITPELSLEHLYWGKALHDEFDLRYLSQSSRMTPFLTSEESKKKATTTFLSHAQNLQEETLEELQETWKKSKISSFGRYVESEVIQKKRLENIAWRLMAMKLFHSTPSNITSTSEKLRGRARSAEMNKGNKGSKSMPSSPAVSNTISTPFATTPRARRMRSNTESNISPRKVFQSRTATTPTTTTTRTNTPRYSASISDLKSLSNEPKTPSSFPYIPPLKPFVPEADSLQPTPRAFDRMLGKIGKGALCVEYSDHGTGDFRSPSFMVFNTCDGSTISPLRYRRHQIIYGKISPPHLPAIRVTDENQASTLIITMGDIGSGLEVDLIYVAMHDYDVLIRRSVFRNMDTRYHQYLYMNPQTRDCLDSNKRVVKVIQRALSMTVDFESTSTPFHLVQLSGSWARERYIVETKLTQGMQSFGSARGVSSHQHNPFAAITIGSPNETQGEVKGFNLIYSGNFIFEADLTEMGRLRVNMGIHPMGFQWHLSYGETFHTPECILARSNEGLGGLSRTLHRLYLDTLIPRNWSDSIPPILLNSWEAKYFNVTHNNLVDMAMQAVQMGIDMIVLDDGWFGERDDDSTSLGDWIPNPKKFPHGLKALVDDINAVGCKFGLWLEPEMISEESTLNRTHPDWYLQVPGRPKQIGRNQYVLDLSREAVRDYLFHSISQLLKSANIEYIKWDMNRPLTEVYSQRANDSLPDEMMTLSVNAASYDNQLYIRSGNTNAPMNVPTTLGTTYNPSTYSSNPTYPAVSTFNALHNPYASSPHTTSTTATNAYMNPVDLNRNASSDNMMMSRVWQSESSHRYILGLYELQDRIMKEFPHVLLENCSSGGGRFDPGMLYYSSQIWCSDNTDAIARMRIQYGTSLAYPARCVGAHVSCVPNHITGNFTRARTRSFVAMCGTYGFELDMSDLSASEIAMFRDHINLYKTIIAPIVRSGDLYRLWDPFKVNFASWMYVSRDKMRAVVFAFSMNSDHWSNLVPRLILQGLLADEVYEITEPIPNNVTQSSGNLRITETEVPVYQLGYNSVRLSGEILMSAGLPVKFYTLDDSIMFYLTRVRKCRKLKHQLKSNVLPSYTSGILSTPHAIYKKQMAESSTKKYESGPMYSVVSYSSLELPLVQQVTGVDTTYHMALSKGDTPTTTATINNNKFIDGYNFHTTDTTIPAPSLTSTPPISNDSSVTTSGKSSTRSDDSGVSKPSTSILKSCVRTPRPPLPIRSSGSSPSRPSVTVTVNPQPQQSDFLPTSHKIDPTTQNDVMQSSYEQNDEEMKPSHIHNAISLKDMLDVHNQFTNNMEGSYVGGPVDPLTSNDCDCKEDKAITLNTDQKNSKNAMINTNVHFLPTTGVYTEEPYTPGSQSTTSTDSSTPKKQRIKPQLRITIDDTMQP